MTTTNTLIAKQTVGSAGATSITFSNIPQNYTDLKLVWSARTNVASVADTLLISINGVNTNTSSKTVQGTGSAVSSSNRPAPNGITGYVCGDNATASIFGTGEMLISNYAAAANKTILTDSASETNLTNSAFRQKVVGLFADTTAVTSLVITPTTGPLIKEYSTFYLYGISNSATIVNNSPKATGGDVITTDGTYWYHTFLYSGTFTPLKNLTCDVMSVGAGGGGGNFGGGGGAGELDLFSSQSLVTQGYAVTIGAGGAGATSGSVNGSSGGTTSFDSLITSLGGGGGGKDATAGGNGGSGGGGGKTSTGGTASGSNTFAGGNGGSNDGGVGAMGGGGGASGGGSAGINVAFTSAVGGNGGQGYLLSSISNKPDVFGSMTRISSGGGGGAFCISSVPNNPVGGTGGAGGGNGGTDKQGGTVAPTAATSFGSGGGGSGGSNNGTAGYQGLVIVRYAV